MKTFKFGLSAIFAIALVCASTHSFATVLSSWTFEAPNTPPDVTDNGTGPNAVSDGGVFAGIVTGLHASAATDWTTPSGNGSVDSLSVNTWTVGDYFQVSTSSLGYQNLTLTFDVNGSNTGPKEFKVAASTDGTTFTDIGFTYTVANDAWSAGTNKPESTRFTGLPASLNNQASIFLRLINTSTVPISSSNPVATGGTSRIDNVIVQGDLVPEPSTFALVALSVGAMMFRRK
jgi:hypothetical protein